MTTQPSSPEEQLAQFFHEAYERLAPSFGYETRPETAIPWTDIPKDNRNKQLMIAVAGEVLKTFDTMRFQQARCNQTLTDKEDKDNTGIQNTLYEDEVHPHKPVNVNMLHREQSATASDRVADWVTSHVGTMRCAYLFAVFASITLLAVFGVFGRWSLLIASAGGAVSSYWLQLVLLPTIMVGQNGQARHSALLAEEQFNTTQKTYHDLEQVMSHLSAQDEELLKQTTLIQQLLKDKS